MGLVFSYMLDIHLLRRIDKALVLLPSLLDIEGVGAHEQEVLHVMKGLLHCVGVVIVHDPECNSLVFEAFAVGFVG